MKITRFASLAFCFVAGIAMGAPEAADRTLVPGERVGAITKATPRAALDALFGAENIKDEVLPGPEGTEFQGTVIYPDDALNRVEIVWADEKKTRPEFARFLGKTTAWKSAEGVTLGLRLKEVEALNGKAFKLYGFEWDYGGYVSDFEGGKLDSEEATLSLRFATKEGDDTGEVSGDGEFSSSEKALQKINPTVEEVTVPLSPPEDRGEGACGN